MQNQSQIHPNRIPKGSVYNLTDGHHGINVGSTINNSTKRPTEKPKAILNGNSWLVVAILKRWITKHELLFNH